MDAINLAGAMAKRSYRVPVRSIPVFGTDSLIGFDHIGEEGMLTYVNLRSRKGHDKNPKMT